MVHQGNRCQSGGFQSFVRSHAPQAAQLQSDLNAARDEISKLYREKSSLLEQTVGATTSAAQHKERHDAAAAQLAEACSRADKLQKMVEHLTNQLANETGARQVATEEMQVRGAALFLFSELLLGTPCENCSSTNGKNIQTLSTFLVFPMQEEGTLMMITFNSFTLLLRVFAVQAALTERDAARETAERLTAENASHVSRIVDMKEKEGERLNEINKIHEEVVRGRSTLALKDHTAVYCCAWGCAGPLNTLLLTCAAF